MNRIDETVVFHPLLKEQIRGIADIQVQLLHQRLQDNDLGLTVSDAVLDKIATLGYDPVYGARPLKRVIQNRIENQLAQQMLQGDFVGGDVIAIELGVDGELVFSKAKAVDLFIAPIKGRTATLALSLFFFVQSL